MSDTIKTVTIHLTGRRPICICCADWPVIARASSKSWDGEFEFQASSILRCWLRVRRHADGRVIVYAQYFSSSRWQGARDVEYSAGEILPAGAGDGDGADLTNTISRVGDDCSLPESVIRACVADLPAEDLS